VRLRSGVNEACRGRRVTLDCANASSSVVLEDAPERPPIGLANIQVLYCGGIGLRRLPRRACRRSVMTSRCHGNGIGADISATRKNFAQSTRGQAPSG
jgi:hypothetical protein